MDNQGNTTVFTKEQLQEAENFAAVGFTRAEIIIIISDNDSNDLDIAIQKGRLMAKYKVRKANFDLAEAGSSPAITKQLELLESAEITDSLDKA